jgi:hypothetical protein
MPFKRRDLKTWFLISGSIGIIVALVLALVASHRSLNPKLLLMLWPSSIVGLADPATPSAKMLIGAYEFGGNFFCTGSSESGLALLCD